MSYNFNKYCILVLFIFGWNNYIEAQKKTEIQIGDSLTLIANIYTYVGRVNVNDISINEKSNKIIVTVNERLVNIPFRPENVNRIYNAISKILPKKYAGFSIVCQVENKNIEDLIPNFYKKDNFDEKRQFWHPLLTPPLVTNLSRPYQADKGLANRHIALWQSHGLYYDQKTVRWIWQRARVFQIVEDLYTQSYVLPFLVPMLENAGANVLLPRERDTQTYEVIVDNDSEKSASLYKEHADRKSWKNGIDAGFYDSKKTYLQGDNPFTFGTYRVIPTVNDSDESSCAEWIPNIPSAGFYAVYISYKSLLNSVNNAHYTVFHAGGKTDFSVNQNLCGSTWLYLGNFYFNKGRNKFGKVILSNLNSNEDKVITADAVKFGGGFGNIARSPNELGSTSNLKSSDSLLLAPDLTKPLLNYEPETSTYPRFTEAARYWLQWAGIPDSIYSRSQGKNDYTDDFQSRGNWVNYLAGGSTVFPNYKGLNVPIDLALAFHSDAGFTSNDSIIGTLGICTIQNSEGKTEFKNGVSRWASRDLTDIIQSQIVNDIRSNYAPEWTRRGLWNKSYSEARVPEVPTMLLELLSHQNFADMRYGLDPNFRFLVSRSIYKGILKYLSSSNKVDYVVQPLPVEQFSCKFIDKNRLELHWVAVNDSLEPTAQAEEFVLYTRIDNGDFDNGIKVKSNRVSLNLQTGKIYSFKVKALNKGGESFPSEILSAYRSPNDKPEVLIVNGFNRISAPASFKMDSTYAGFLNDVDAGVPYISDISMVGKQYEFNRSKPWINDDAPGFGASHANYETKVIVGNSFDYPYLHGKAIKAAGFSYVSSSVKAIIHGDIDMNEFKMVDLILGKQKQTFIGNGQKEAKFKTFPLALQQIIRSYCQKGGNLMLSGAYLASDLCEGEKALQEDRQFLENVLKLKFRTSKASVNGNVIVINSPNKYFPKSEISYFDQPNDTSYFVESPDAIEPIGEGGFSICRYAENKISAAVAYSGQNKICAFGFPFETIESQDDRNKLMESVLSFFNSTETK
jgi:hypothetical protein